MGLQSTARFCISLFMPVEMSDLMQLALGQREHLLIGELPRPVAAYLSSNPGLLYLGKAEFRKIAEKHREIAGEEFQCLPLFLRAAAYYTVPGKPNCVTFFARGVESRLPYLCGIKATANGGEVWIQTFHRTTDRKAERKIGSGALIYGWF